MSAGDVPVAPDEIVLSVKKNELGPVEEWLAAGNSADSFDSRGDPLLVIATYFGATCSSDCAMTKLLLSAGATVDLKAGDDCTALMAAVLCSSGARAGAELARLLVEHGADVNLRESILDETALMRAAEHAPPCVVATLLRAGASLDARNRKGRNAEESAVRRGRSTKYLLADVRLAGGWARFIRQPIVALNVLRVLCQRGRAAAPRTRASRVLAKLFDERLPRELFVQVLLFWRSARVTGEDRDGDEQRLRDELQLQPPRQGSAATGDAEVNW